MTRFLISAAVFATLAVPAAAGSISFYGRNGSYAGSAITRGGYTTFTDGGGRYLGSSITRGRTTIVYGANGNRVGSSTRTGRR